MQDRGGGREDSSAGAGSGHRSPAPLRRRPVRSVPPLRCSRRPRTGRSRGASTGGSLPTLPFCLQAMVWLTAGAVHHSPRHIVGLAREHESARRVFVATPNASATPQQPSRPVLRGGAWSAGSFPDLALYLSPRGPLAQLGERLPCTEEVSGSIPLRSTMICRGLVPCDTSLRPPTAIILKPEMRAAGWHDLGPFGLSLSPGRSLSAADCCRESCDILRGTTGAARRRTASAAPGTGKEGRRCDAERMT